MMEIVIKISEDEYNIAKYGQYGNINVDIVRKAIENGTPLPKGHGRLIDADKLNIYDVSPNDGFVVMGVTEEDIDLAATIIPADKGVLEKINEKQDSLRATCKAWDEAISRDGYVN